MKSTFEDFEEFILWLKRDGLSPQKSERLWRKKIFSNLQNEHKNSLANYQDFLVYKKLNNLLGKSVVYKDINSSICKISIEQANCILTMQNRDKLRIKLDEVDNFINNNITKE